MRSFVVVGSMSLATALVMVGVGCGADHDDEAIDSALTPARSPHRVPESLATDGDAGSKETKDAAEDVVVVEEVGGFDSDLGPIGHCLNGGFDWTCRAGRTCTFTGHCTPADAGPSSAGSQPCGLIFCDLAYCRCRNAGTSLCDCE